MKYLLFLFTLLNYLFFHIKKKKKVTLYNTYNIKWCIKKSESNCLILTTTYDSNYIISNNVYSAKKMNFRCATLFWDIHVKYIFPSLLNSETAEIWQIAVTQWQKISQNVTKNSYIADKCHTANENIQEKQI